MIAEIFLASENNRHRPFYRVDLETGQSSDEPEYFLDFKEATEEEVRRHGLI